MVSTNDPVERDRREQDSIPDEKFVSVVRLPRDFDAVKFVHDFLERYKNDYEKAAQISVEGVSLSNVEDALRQAGCSDLEIALGSYAIVKKILGQNGGSVTLEEVKDVIYNAFTESEKLPWYKGKDAIAKSLEGKL